MSESSSSEYFILAENQRKKKALAEVKGRYDALLLENRQLLEERETSEQETYEVTEYLRQEIVQKTDKILELEASMRQLEVFFEKEKETNVKRVRSSVPKVSSCVPLPHPCRRLSVGGGRVAKAGSTVEQELQRPRGGEGESHGPACRGCGLQGATAGGGGRVAAAAGAGASAYLSAHPARGNPLGMLTFGVEPPSPPS